MTCDRIGVQLDVTMNIGIGEFAHNFAPLSSVPTIGFDRLVKGRPQKQSIE
ncbi:MAG: hypothetical protein IT450_14655 [Phycisphaerales bacterium]|nr:hypothetical protein [Phycisphaerales bacterium]